MKQEVAIDMAKDTRAVCFEKETKVEADACMSGLESRFGGVAGEFFQNVDNSVTQIRTRLLDIADRREAAKRRRQGV